MLANIDKTEVLENKSAALADQAKTFHKTARATKRQMCKQNMKMNLIIACVCGARPAHAVSAPIPLSYPRRVMRRLPHRCPSISSPGDAAVRAPWPTALQSCS